MTSYLVLEAPGGPDRDHRTTRFIADRFSWLAFLFPWIWFAVHRAWWIAIATVILQVAAGRVSGIEGFEMAGLLCAIVIASIAGFEGRNLVHRNLVARGWILKDVVVASTLSTAEEMYFSSLPEAEQPADAVSRPEWKTRVTKDFMMNDPAGSFQFDLNGRR